MGLSAEQTLLHAVNAAGTMKAAQRIDLNLEQADGLLKRFEAGCLQAGDYEIIKAMVETIELLSQCVDEKATVENAAADYTAAEQIKVDHPTLKPTDNCPGCLKGILYEIVEKEAKRIYPVYQQVNWLAKKGDY